MHEMLEIVLKILLLIGLFYIAWYDYKTKLIEAEWLVLFGVLGLAGVLLQGDVTLLWQSCQGMMIGGVLLLFAWISGESVGFGDGWLFVVTGIFLGLLKNFVLLFGSMVLAGLFAICCLVLKKKGRNDRVALAPFVLMAYVVFVL